MTGKYKGAKNLWRKPHGKGVLKSEDLKYRGTFKNGKLSGIGRITYKDKSVFQGEFSNNMRNGPGELMTQNEEGAVLQLCCHWKDNKPEGTGLLQVRGSSYLGDFSNGLRHGRGTLRNGRAIGLPSYDGDWVKN